MQDDLKKVNPSKKKHSGFGIASFILSVIVPILLFITIYSIVLLENLKRGVINEGNEFTTTMRVIAFILFITAFIAAGLGVAGLTQKERKKIFAVIGTFFSVSLIVLVILSFMILLTSAS